MKKLVERASATLLAQVVVDVDVAKFQEMAGFNVKSV